MTGNRERADAFYYCQVLQDDETNISDIGSLLAAAEARGRESGIREAAELASNWGEHGENILALLEKK